MNTLLAISEKDYAFNLFEQGYNFGEVALFGLQIVGIGLLTIFSVLCLIWFALIIFQKVFSRPSTSTKTEKAVEAVLPVYESAPLSYSNDEEIVAVIAAAIAMAESESDGLKFRVVSFRRK